MTIPAFIFGSFVAILFGALFHLWRGGGLGRMVVFLFSSLVGFWVGHFAAALWNIRLWDIGPLRFGPSIVGALLFLNIGRWLIEFKQPTS